MENIAKIIEEQGLDRAINSYGDRHKELRLFAVWCARQVQYLLNEPRLIDAIDIAERYANGLSSRKELSRAWKNSIDISWGELPKDLMPKISKSWRSPIKAMTATIREWDASSAMAYAQQAARDTVMHTIFEVHVDGSCDAVAAHTSASSMFRTFSWVAMADAILFGDHNEQALDRKMDSVRDRQEAAFLQIMKIT